MHIITEIIRVSFMILLIRLNTSFSLRWPMMLLTMLFAATEKPQMGVILIIYAERTTFEIASWCFPNFSMKTKKKNQEPIDRRFWMTNGSYSRMILTTIP